MNKNNLKERAEELAEMTHGMPVDATTLSAIILFALELKEEGYKSSDFFTTEKRFGFEDDE